MRRARSINILDEMLGKMLTVKRFKLQSRLPIPKVPFSKNERFLHITTYASQNKVYPIMLSIITTEQSKIKTCYMIFQRI